MSFIFLGESLHLGSVIGGVIICVGFYVVIWGKANDEEGENEDSSKISFNDEEGENEDSSKISLLQSP
ncbi:hypothetical protein CICLE_v10018396mg [Citrus x clementina]|uniref:WAT1-related protein n=2 Tax=Citrus clementina TaxID=85681 RepID=V4W1F6_CITCL|nr:hypothetical protein CICLE_v10018396mg [Citrus x clementina]